MDRIDEQATVAIVGGGAAGLAAAVAAGGALRGSGAGRIVLCEASDRVGRSILATGNGRCNFSNAQLTGETLVDAEALELFYHNADFVAQAFAALEGLSPFTRDVSEQACSPSERMNAVLRFFGEHGLVWREEGEGRLYPLANKASSMLDVLRAAVEAVRADTLTGFSVRAIVRQAAGGFLLEAEDGRMLQAQRVIVACGGSVSESLAASLGLPFVDQRPVLGPLAVVAQDRRITKRLDNIRVKARVTLLRERKRSADVLRCEQGEVLFRSYGLSGIAAFDLSREAQAGDEVSLCLLPPELAADAADFLTERAARLRRANGEIAVYGDVLRGLVLPQVAAAVCERAQVKVDETCNAPGIERVARVLSDWRFTVEGIGDARQCQVSCGGIAVDALDATTLEALAVPGLHVVGEALDVDAACGGFNLHWAWASGLLAGSAAARSAAQGVEGSR